MHNKIIKNLKIDLIGFITVFPFALIIVLLAGKVRRLTPNLMTIVGFISVLTGIYLSLKHGEQFYIGIGVFVFLVMDVADGLTARLYQRGSKIGIVLDLLCDRASLGLIYFSLSFLYIKNGQIDYYIMLSFFTVLFYAIDSIWLIVMTARSALFGENEKNKKKNVKDRTFFNVLIQLPDRFSAFILLSFFLVGLGDIFMYASIACIILNIFSIFYDILIKGYVSLKGREKS